MSTDKKETPYQKYKKTRLENGDFVSTKKTEINKEISHAWKAMSDEEKVIYGFSAKKLYRKKTGYDVFLKEAMDDLSLTSTTKVNADAVRDNTARLWKRMSPEDQQKYEDVAGSFKKRKRVLQEDNEPRSSMKKKEKKVAFDFYLDEKRDELDQKAITFGFSTDQVLFMAMMTFQNLSSVERQKYTDLAENPNKDEPLFSEVFLIVDDEETTKIKTENS